MNGLAGRRRHHHFGLVGFSVLEGPDHGAVVALAVLALVDLVAAEAPPFAEVLLEAAIDCLQAQFPVLHGDVAGRFVEKLLVSVFGGAKLFSELSHFGNIGRYFQDQIQLSPLFRIGAV